MNARRKLALSLLLGLSTSLGCKTMPWSSSAEATAPTASAPSAGKQRYELLAKEFPQEASAAGIGPAPPQEDNWFVAGWKKTTAAVAAPFSSSPTVESDDPVSLSTKTGKIGPDVYISAARILEGQGKYAEAEAKYHAALKSSPNDLTTLISLARCYDRQNKASQAVETYQKAIKAHPKSALAHNDAGLCYGRLKQTDAAVKHLNQAIELQPQNIRYYNNLATVLVEAGHAEQACQLLTRVNSPAIAHYNVACLLHAQGQPAEATRFLQVALSQDGNLVQARELLASIDGASQPRPEQRVSALPASYSMRAGAPPAASLAPPGYTPPSPPSQTTYGPPAAPPAAPQTGPYPASPAPPSQNSFSPWR